MTLISVTFVLFLGITLLVYYVLPAGRRWISLLCASLIFYLCSGWKRIAFVFATAVVGFICPRRIQRLYDANADAEEADPAVRKKARRILVIGLIAVIPAAVFAGRILYLEHKREQMELTAAE